MVKSTYCSSRGPEFGSDASDFQRCLHLRQLCLNLYLTFSLSLSHSLTMSVSMSLPLTLSLSLYISVSLSLCLCLSLSVFVSLTMSLSRTSTLKYLQNNFYINFTWFLQGNLHKLFLKFFKLKTNDTSNQS